MDTNRIVSALVCCVCFAAIEVAQGINVVVQTQLSNTCTNCLRRGCVVVDSAPSPLPIFSARDSGKMENESAVNLAIAHSRFHLADGLEIKAQKRLPPAIDEIAFCPMPYCVDGVCLTNMTARVFAFDVSPAFSSKSLPCTLVSFYSTTSIVDDTYIYSLYVNDATGCVGLSIQECSCYMAFLSNAMQYPFLSNAECLKQNAFVGRMVERKYKNMLLPSPSVPQGLPTKNRHLLPDIEVNDSDI